MLLVSSEFLIQFYLLYRKSYPEYILRKLYVWYVSMLWLSDSCKQWWNFRKRESTILAADDRRLRAYKWRTRRRSAWRFRNATATDTLLYVCCVHLWLTKTLWCQFEKRKKLRLKCYFISISSKKWSYKQINNLSARICCKR